MARPRAGRSSAGVTIRGLDEFERGLRGAPSAMRRALGRAHQAIGEEVLDWAVENAQRSSKDTAQKMLNERAIRSSAKVRDVTIVLDAGKHPAVMGAEFGAKRYRRFEPWTGNQFEVGATDGVGYIVLPAIRDNVEKLEEVVWQHIDAALTPAFPDGLGGLSLEPLTGTGFF